MSQLGLGLGLTRGGGVPFNPLSLNPYLLFDTRSSMIGTFENPTLDLDPSDPDTLDVITATRSGVATYTDEDGLIQSASADTVRVDYVQGEELTPTKYQHITNTDFSSGWLDFGVAQTANYGISPDGTNNSTRLVFSDANKAFYRFVLHGSDSETNTLYVKGNAGETIKFGRAAVVNAGQIFTLTGEWQRLEYVSTTGNQFSISTYSGATARDLEIWGPQVEEGTTASAFVSNTTGSPKFIASATYGPRVPMILVEPSATNLVTYSEDFSNSSWTKTDVTVSAAPVAAPDGTMTATHVVSTGSNAHLVRLGVPSGTHTTSIWARTASGAGTCFFKPPELGGVLTTVTDQWQRFDVPANTHVYAVDFRGGGVTLDEIYIWGAQVEEGSVATSYIPTSGSTVTRQADDLQIERDSTNLLPYSQDFTQISWTKQAGTTVTPNTTETVSPDGTYNASKVTSDGSNGILDSAVSSASENTKSVWLKGVNGGEQVVLKDPNQTITQKTLTLTTEWVRYSLTETQSASFGIWIDDIPSSGIYMWGAQVETGDLTSYIPTSGAAASRTTFSDFFNSGGDGTFYAEFTTRTITEAQVYVLAGHSSTQRYMYSNLNDANLKSFDGYSDNFGGDIQTTLNRASISYNSNSKICSMNGSADVTHVGTGDLQDSTRLSIGQSWSDLNQLNGHLKRLIYWPVSSDLL